MHRNLRIVHENFNKKNDDLYHAFFGNNEKLLTTLTIEGVDSGARVTIPVEITKEVITTSLTQGQTGVTLG